MKKLFTLVMAVLAFGAINAQTARIVVENHDVWQDGTGYQILLDADCAGWAESHGPDCGSDYTQWEYTVPANASANDETSIVEGQCVLDIPAGTYSYLVVNPNCESLGINYIASRQCEASNEESYNFEAGKTYIFTFEIVGTNDCVNITVQNSTNVEEVVADQVRIYPNPATDVLNVEGNGFYEISNILGQVVMDGTVAGHTTVNVANLNNGVYFVNVNGQSMKFVKR